MLFNVLIIMIFLPFFLSFCSLLCGRFIGRFGVCLLLPFVFGTILNFFLINQSLVYVSKSICITFKLSSWFGLMTDWGFLFDGLSLEMSGLILSITFCVLLYAAEYMFHDMHIIRFMSFLCLFSFFMLFMVTSSNYFQMFVGWEGVGFVSFLLINFWFTRLEANRSGLKAMLFNRVGDSFFLIGLLILWVTFKTTDILVVNFLLSTSFFLTITDVVLVCFFLAAVGKSAQLGLHAWLPDAMEGPTPVSSLLHSATMVTAGIFLLLRLTPIFLHSRLIVFFMLFGSFTAFFNALFAVFQFDLKKIIAFSTCSQLGMMLVGVVFQPVIGLYHLLNHGFFKALLFLSAGCLIHAVNDEQDLRKIGSISAYKRLVYLAFVIGSCAIIGFPFFSGFYSKELLLFVFYNYSTISGYFLFFMLFFTSVFTCLYSLKILKKISSIPSKINGLVFFKKFDFFENYMLYSVVIILILSISHGYLFEHFFFFLGSNVFYDVIFFDFYFFKSLFFSVEFNLLQEYVFDMVYRSEHGWTKIHIFYFIFGNVWFD